MEAVSSIDGQILKGLLDTLVLRVLVEEDNYGFAILTLIKEKFGLPGDLLKEATLYPLLHRLESKELVRSYYQPGDRGTPRKYYRITPKGKKLLVERKLAWKQVTTILERLLAFEFEGDQKHDGNTKSRN